MNKKFKRLISVILTVMMAIGMMPFSGLTTVSAATTLTKNSTIYFNTNGNTTFTKDGAVPSVIFKSSDSNDALSGWVTMTLVSGNVYSATVPVSGASYVQFRRSSSTGANWNSGTKNLAVVSGKDMFKITSWSNSSWNNSTGSWSTYSGGSSGGETTTGTFNVDADLVDYLNDSRVGVADDSTGDNPNVYWNQGNATGPDNKPYSKLNQWLSGLTGYANNGISSTSSSNAPVPLYFGDLLHANQAGGNLTWYWKGANVAFGPNNDTANKDVAQGIVGSQLVNGNLVTSYTYNGQPVKVPFFNEGAYANQSDYMHFYNNLQFPFQSTTTNGVTKYSFDSKQNNVYYDYASKRIVSSNTTIHDVKNASGYFPFNSYDPASGDRWKLNYGFGTKFTIPFTINTNGKDANGGDVTFNFTGDDDVWVYIDGALVLDMGGAHELAEGSINFATQKVKIATGTSDAKIGNQSTAGGRSAAVNNGKKEIEFSSITVKLADGTTTTLAEHMKQEGEVHTLVMYYMERGMWNSNMSINFSFVPLPSGLSLSKDVNVEQVNAGLQEDARIQDNFDFKIDDGDNSKEYNYVLDFNGDGVTDPITTTNRVVTGVSDNAYAKDFKYASGTETGLKLGTNFTITETVDSTKYSTRWFVTDLKTSSSTPVAQDTTTVAKFKLGEADPDNPFATASYNVNFINTMKVGTVAVKKAWGAGTAPTDTEFDFKVEVDLSGTGNTYQVYALDYTSSDISRNGTTEADGSFKIKANETVTFAGIPVGAKVKVTETTTSGDSWTVDGEAFKESSALTAGSVVLLTITNKTNSVDVNKVIYVEAGKTTTYTPNDVTFTGASLTSVSSSTTATAAINGKGLDISVKDADRKCIFKIEGTDSTGANLSSNSTLTVYSYKATDKVYVFDYGLKSDISETNTNGDGLFQGGVFYNTEAEKTTDYKTNATLGAVTGDGNTQTAITPDATVSINKDGSSTGSVTFEPKAFMDQAENYKYTADITKTGATLNASNPETGTVVNGTIKVMPASVVYYEDNFNAGTNTNDSSVKIIYGSYCTTEGTALELTQSNGQTEQYGHDDAYANGVGDSAGSSTAMRADATAAFTFKGTGFDIIARTTTETAGIVYQIQDGNGRPVKIGAVDTFYANGDLYQIPVIHEEGLTYGTYTVTMGIKANETGEKVFVYLDGIRIYNPMGVSGDSAYIDNEESATVSKVSSLILGNGEVTETGIVDQNGKTIKKATIPESKAALLGYDETDGLSALGYTVTEDITTPEEDDVGYSSETQSILQVLHSGPNNEVYLSDGSAVGFVATADSSTSKTLQIEAKLVNTGSSTDPISSSATLQYLNNSKTATDAATISTATAMYYEIPVENCISLGNNQYLVALLGKTTDDGLQVLSFSNVKVKGYTLSNPYDNTTAKDLIDTSAIDDESPFVSFGTKLTSIRKNTWTTYQVAVTADCKAQLGDKPFTLYYTNGDTKAEITVTATENGTNTYNLRFKTPNAVGKFPLELHYVDQSGNESSEYISTTLNVKK